MRPISLSDEHLDDLDADTAREFDGHGGEGLGRKNRSSQTEPESFFDLFDSYEDEEIGEDEDSKLFEDDCHD